MIDLQIIKAHKPDTPAIVDITGDKVSGISLLAQRVVIVLLTDISDLLRSMEGSSLVSSIGNSQSSLSYVSLLVTSALADVSEAIRRDPGEASSDDEILSELSIYDISENDGDIIVTLNVLSKSGESMLTKTNIGSLI